MVGVDVTLSHKKFPSTLSGNVRVLSFMPKSQNKKKKKKKQKKHCHRLCNYGYAFCILSEFGSIPFKNEIDLWMLSCYILVC